MQYLEHYVCSGIELVDCRPVVLFQNRLNQIFHFDVFTYIAEHDI